MSGALRSPNPYGNSAGEGAAGLVLARQRSEMAAGELHLIGQTEAAQLARVSVWTLRAAWKAGDLAGVPAHDGSGIFDPEAVKAWARSKRYIA
jgi:hypothetical protein